MTEAEQERYDAGLDAGVDDEGEPDAETGVVRLYSTRDAIAAIRADRSVLGDPYRLAALLDRLVAGCNERAYQAGHSAALVEMTTTDRDTDIDF